MGYSTALVLLISVFLNYGSFANVEITTMNVKEEVKHVDISNCPPISNTESPTAFIGRSSEKKQERNKDLPNQLYLPYSFISSQHIAIYKSDSEDALLVKNLSKNGIFVVGDNQNTIRFCDVAAEPVTVNNGDIIGISFADAHKHRYGNLSSCKDVIEDVLKHCTILFTVFSDYRNHLYVGIASNNSNFENLDPVQKFTKFKSLADMSNAVELELEKVQQKLIEEQTQRCLANIQEPDDNLTNTYPSPASNHHPDSEVEHSLQEETSDDGSVDFDLADINSTGTEQDQEDDSDFEYSREKREEIIDEYLDGCFDTAYSDDATLSNHCSESEFDSEWNSFKDGPSGEEIPSVSFPTGQGTQLKRKHSSDCDGSSKRAQTRHIAELINIVSTQSIQIEEQRREITRLKNKRSFKAFSLGALGGSIGTIAVLFKIASDLKNGKVDL